jgi:hypothetical protein
MDDRSARTRDDRFARTRDEIEPEVRERRSEVGSQRSAQPLGASPQFDQKRNFGEPSFIREVGNRGLGRKDDGGRKTASLGRGTNKIRWQMTEDRGRTTEDGVQCSASEVSSIFIAKRSGFF